MEKVTLYIPCYNAEEYLKLCLESVLGQRYPIDEILVIDDGSTDKTLDIAENFPVKIIRHDTNRGLAAARNTAFKQASNEFVASLDADCLADPDWLQELMVNFKNKMIAGAGGRLIEEYNENAAGQWRSVHMPQHWGDRDVINPDFLFGSNAVVKKSIVSSLGFYNEKFKSNFEDVDISRKILAKGWQLIYSPKARAKHIKNDSIKSVLNAFWNWHCYRYSHPKETASSLKRFFKNISLMVMSLKFFINDIKLKHYKILCLDILMFIYLPVLSTNDLFKGLHRNCIFAGDGKK